MSEHPENSHFRWRDFAGFAALATWVFVPLIVAVILMSRIFAITVDPELEVWVPVESSESEVIAPVGLSLGWDEGQPVIAPAWSGLVQEVLVGSGDELRSGSAIAVVDGIIRTAWATEVPFSRVLDIGSRGAEVAQLHTLLRGAGIDAPEGDRFTRATGVATATFARKQGVAVDGAIVAFDPAWVIYLPAEPLVLKKLDLTVAAPAPAPGTQIGETAPKLTNAMLIDAATVNQILQQSEGISAAQEPIVIDEASLLRVSDTELLLTEDRTHVADADLHIVQKAANELTPAIRAITVTTLTNDAWVVPSAAVFSSSTGKTCVQVRDEGDVRGVEVSVVSQGQGRTVLEGTLSIGEEVAISPLAGARSC